MRRVAIDDPNDPRLSPFLDLRDTRMRTAREPAEGFFLAEGVLTIRRALAAGYEPRAVLSTERLSADLDDLDVTTYVVSDAVLEATTGFPVHRGALAKFPRRPMPDPTEGARRRASSGRPGGPRRHDQRRRDLPRGCGARMARGCGVGALRRPLTVAPVVPRWARSSPFRGRGCSHGPGMEILREAGFTVWRSPRRAPSISLGGGTRPPALLVGSEGPGVSRGWLEAADLRSVSRCPPRSTR